MTKHGEKRDQEEKKEIWNGDLSPIRSTNFTAVEQQRERDASHRTNSAILTANQSDTIRIVTLPSSNGMEMMIFHYA